jgi:ATP-binding cassette subfamily C (CFTR/MRP) protein 10
MYSFFGEAQAARDSRVKLVNELVFAIRVVKFYAWEKAFEEKISM